MSRHSRCTRVNMQKKLSISGHILVFNLLLFKQLVPASLFNDCPQHCSLSALRNTYLLLTFSCSDKEGEITTCKEVTSMTNQPKNL